MTLFTILICWSRKKGFRHIFTSTIKALTYTYVPAGLAHFTHSASIVRNRKTQRSMVRGRGTSIDKQITLRRVFIYKIENTDLVIRVSCVLLRILFYFEARKCSRQTGSVYALHINLLNIMNQRKLLRGRGKSIINEAKRIE